MLQIKKNKEQVKNERKDKLLNKGLVKYNGRIKLTSPELYNEFQESGITNFNKFSFVAGELYITIEDSKNKTITDKLKTLES